MHYKKWLVHMAAHTVPRPGVKNQQREGAQREVSTPKVRREQKWRRGKQSHEPHHFDGALMSHLEEAEIRSVRVKMKHASCLQHMLLEYICHVP